MNTNTKLIKISRNTWRQAGLKCERRKRRAHRWFLCLAFGWSAIFLLPNAATAQEDQTQDPATDSKVIEKTLSKIRQVEQLDKFIGENQTLKSENEQLKQQIASLDKQVKKLTEELKVENERLRKQLVQMPTFRIKSKLVGSSRAMAVLEFGEKTIRIRQGIELSVPVAEGVWTLMKVLKISNDFIELEFPELERTVLLYD